MAVAEDPYAAVLLVAQGKNAQVKPGDGVNG